MYPKSMNTWKLESYNDHEVVYSSEFRTVIHGHEITNFLYQIKKVDKNAKIKYIAIVDGHLEITFKVGV